MNSGSDAARLQVLPQTIPVVHPNYKEMEIVFSAGWDFRRTNAGVAELGRICLRVLEPGAHSIREDERSFTESTAAWIASSREFVPTMR